MNLRKESSWYLTRLATGALFIAAVVCFICIGVGLFHFWQNRAARRVDWRSVAERARENPISVPLASRPAAGVGDIDLESICRQLRPIDKEQLDLSAVLHIIRIWGASYEVRIPTDELPHSLLDVLTDERLGQLAFGSSPMIITDFGVRYPGVEPFGRIRNAHRAGESHRDQFLSTMAELRIPLSQVISTNAGKHDVREVLSDSLAQFHLEQEELAWTAYAYALYLPPQSRWQNRYAEESSFDDVAEELLARPLGKASCCGTHIVFALTAIFHADSAFPILKPSMRQRIEKRLHEWLEILVAKQLPDGGWLPAWWLPPDVPNQSTARLAAVSARGDLLATSHLVEWLYMLPNTFDVPRRTTDSATRYLLQRLRAATEAEMRERFCPYSHAGHVLRTVNR